MDDGEAHGFVALTQFFAQASEHLQIALDKRLETSAMPEELVKLMSKRWVGHQKLVSY